MKTLTEFISETSINEAKILSNLTLSSKLDVLTNKDEFIWIEPSSEEYGFMTFDDVINTWDVDEDINVELKSLKVGYSKTIKNKNNGDAVIHLIRIK